MTRFIRSRYWAELACLALLAVEARALIVMFS